MPDLKRCQTRRKSKSSCAATVTQISGCSSKPRPSRRDNQNDGRKDDRLHSGGSNLCPDVVDRPFGCYSLGTMVWVFGGAALLLVTALCGGVAVGKRVRGWDAAPLRGAAGQGGTTRLLRRHAIILTAVAIVWLVVDSHDWIVLVCAAGVYCLSQIVVITRAGIAHRSRR